jgi:N-acetylglutamate synthase-like GNAT family acetyltransferase
MFGLTLDTKTRIEPLELNRDFAEIDRLLEQEEWPFIRSDLEVSLAQPNSTAFVARRDDAVLAFFATHNFDDVGYLDMMIVDPPARRTHIAQKLYFQTIKEMKAKGLHSFLAHSTNDSFRMFKFLKFKQGESFTLLAREADDELIELGLDHETALVDLDAAIFGVQRPTWIRALLEDPNTEFLGRIENNELVGSVCLRQRKNNALCIDTVNSQDFSTMEELLNTVFAKHADRRLECFAKTESPLHHYLLRRGFSVPEFFDPIGPLVEWRKGTTEHLGTSPLVQSLSWF